jgi:L-threonylcarbamoyladenylate synthase
VTTVLRADDAAAIGAARDALAGGGLVVVPTDTVYGLAARPTEVEAVRAVYRAKGRPEGMHLPVMASDVEQVRALGVAYGPVAQELARRWWPGPLTMAFAFAPGSRRPQWLTGRDEVAVRIPDHAFLRSLLAETGVLVVTSANPHGLPTPRTAEDVAACGLGSSVEVIIDGGALTEVPSTLVNVAGAQAVVEREGVIAADEIGAAVSEVVR